MVSRINHLVARGQRNGPAMTQPPDLTNSRSAKTCGACIDPELHLRLRRGLDGSSGYLGNPASKKLFDRRSHCGRGDFVHAHRMVKHALWPAWLPVFVPEARAARQSLVEHGTEVSRWRDPQVVGRSEQGHGWHFGRRSQMQRGGVTCNNNSSRRYKATTSRSEARQPSR